MVHDEVHHLDAREHEGQRCHVEEGAAAHDAEPEGIQQQGSDEIDAALPEREQVLRHHYTHQGREQEEEGEADEYYFLVCLQFTAMFLLLSC